MSIFGPDYYHLNFNDGPLPITQIKAADDRIKFVILKYTQGGSYPAAWAVEQGKRVRDAGLILGGYHMLDGDSLTPGSGQAEYFLSQYDPQPGDIVPAVDFEDSGRGNAALSTYKTRLLDFISTVHDHGFEVMLYGHSTVAAAFDDWRKSGADYWWCPGSSIHSDVGPRGPDLWQYAPYSRPTGYPLAPTGQPTDMSVVLTQLPLVKEPDVALTKDQEAALNWALGARAGIKDFLSNTDPAKDAPVAEQNMFDALKKAAQAGVSKADITKAVDDAIASAPVPPPSPHTHTATTTISGSLNSTS